MYPFLNNNGSNSNPQEHYHTPLSYSPFVLPPSPSYIPLEDEAVFYDFLRQQHDQFLFNDHNHNNEQILTNNVKLAEHDDSLRIKRVISSNRDRHSKIHTARGLRDRRIRLSCDVAKKFFGLQDLLGFDMASKTVDWLLTESKTAILDLLPDPKCSFVGVSNYTVSSTSECEVVSGSTGDDQFMVKTRDDQAATKNKAKSCSRVRKCANFNQHLAKETRVRARQRARERTIEKQNKYKHDVCQDPIFRSCLDQVISDQVSWS